jgi:hypothetical protein
VARGTVHQAFTPGRIFVAVTLLQTKAHVDAEGLHGYSHLTHVAVASFAVLAS